jgi:hypothetical protein
MATILEYADIARAVYEKQVAYYPKGHLLPGWSIRTEDWENGSTIFGNGFQGGIYQSETEVVLGFAGTKNAVSDISADARIAFNILPNQCTSAFHMACRAQEILKGRTLTATGHSLGGALAQVIGAWCGIPFVTFNAPPMKNAMRTAKINLVKPQMMMRSHGKDLDTAVGINFRVDGDWVSGAGMKHIGPVITLPKTGQGILSHFMDICYDLIKSHEKYRSCTIMELCA